LHTPPSELKRDGALETPESVVLGWAERRGR